ncbi:hypothetical protein [Actinospongicola halichondriae]|uniref:hypothetical protein n=1 Tax=Actinospongicola halichondriae TaxID=3236844 RepID=UPI003D39736C
MPTLTTIRRAAGSGFAALLFVGAGLGAAACSDEDGDGNTADEELDQLEDDVRDGADEVEEQIDEGAEEDNEN